MPEPATERPSISPASPVGAALFIERPESPQGPPPAVGEDLSNGPNLSDAETLRRLADEVASGLEGQAMAADARTGVSGHPFPQQFFGHAAAVVRALAGFLPAARELDGTPAPAATGTKKK